jgi:hypothetical protein
MKPRFFRLLLMLALLTAMLVTWPSSPVSADTHIVTNINDSGPGSLRQAVAEAGGGDTITFSGVSGTILLLSQIEISQSITITGPGRETLSVSGGDLVRIFRITGENVSISGLTITHGYVADDYGGGILHWQGTLTLDDVAVTHSQALKTSVFGFGGGIYNLSGTLVMTDSSLSYNTANNMGGGLYNYFGAGLSMTNVSVDHNQVLVDSGGGLGIRGNSTGQPVLPISLDRVSVTDNLGTYSGGGIWSDASMSLTNSLVALNTTPGRAGGLFFYDGGTNSLPITIDITNTTVAGNTSVLVNAGMYINLKLAASSVTLNNVTIAKNQINGPGNGAGLFRTGVGGPVSLENSLIAGNLFQSTKADCSGTFVSLDYNLIETTVNCDLTGATGHNITGLSAQISDLADNGGPTQTMALLGDSPPRDAGNDLTCALTDQRGVTRPQGSHCDMGAFELAQYRLMVDKAGTEQGTVTSDPPGIDCGSTCSCYFVENTVVTLTATPFEGSAFDGWSSDVCSGIGTCTFTMDSTKSVTAIFSLELVRIFLPLVFR